MIWWIQYIFGFVIIFVGLGLWRTAINRTRRLYHALRTSSRAIAALEPGDTVMVQGTVELLDGQSVEAHIAGGDAVITRSVVERYEKRLHTPGRHWDSFHRDYDAVPFLLEDETGALVVRPPEDAERFNAVPGAVIDVDLRRRVVRGNEQTPRDIQSYAEKIDGAAYPIQDSALDVRVGQGAIRPGDEISVTGDVIDGSSQYENHSRNKMVLTGRRHPERFRVSSVSTESSRGPQTATDRVGSLWGDIFVIILSTSLGAIFTLAGAFLLDPTRVQPILEAMYELLL